MSGCIELFDQAIEIGERELELLAEGDVDGAQELAGERDKVLTKACVNYADVDKDQVLDRLRHIQRLQQSITAEAMRLHEEIRSQLGDTKKESQRMKGYGGAVRPTPLVPNKFLNKQG